jgi:hypothetical protein
MKAKLFDDIHKDNADILFKLLRIENDNANKKQRQERMRMAKIRKSGM